MSVQFYVGRAGSGKTRRCLDETTDELKRDPSPRGAPLFWILPEQATAQGEMALLSRLPGFARAQVISFRRLVNLAIKQSAAGSRPLLSEESRLLILRSVAIRNKGNLRIFGRSCQQQGFLERLNQFFREMAQYGHSIADLEQRVAALEAEKNIILANKLLS